MYINYGDKDFFELGILVDTEHSNTEFSMIRCLPYPEKEDLYQFAMLTVDITDSWINKEAVMSYIGMSEDTFDPVQYAIGCTDYYSWLEFGAGFHDADWQQVNAAYIVDVLKNQMIASDNLDMPWKE